MLFRSVTTRSHIASSTKISKHCTFCPKTRKNKYTESLRHFLECDTDIGTHRKQLCDMVKSLDQMALNRRASSKDPGMIDLCRQFIDWKVHDKEWIDLLLGVGKIQILNSINSKYFKQLKDTICDLQSAVLIPILKKKDRRHLNFFDLVESFE